MKLDYGLFMDTDTETAYWLPGSQVICDSPGCSRKYALFNTSLIIGPTLEPINCHYKAV